MDAIKDEPGKYASHGFKLTHGLRVGRRVQVPNLSPSYITNHPDTMLLLPPSASTGHWTLQQRVGKTAELIGAYRFRKPAGTVQRELEVPETRNGSLEVVNSHTALVVHKQWFLLLGLGRYGTREDAGVLQTTGIRRDLGGEVAKIRIFKPIIPSSNRPRRPFREADNRSISRDGILAQALQTPWGGWTMQLPTKPIRGITGSLLSLGRQRGSFSQLTSISFVPHTACQIFGSGVLQKEEVLSLHTFFWLAHGFLPTNAFVNGKEVVIVHRRWPPLPLRPLDETPQDLERLSLIGKTLKYEPVIQDRVRMGRHWFLARDLELAVLAFLRLEWGSWDT
ncbi:hypothetical protein B0T25DRAFT_580072 [Lasiosphaeria hispida]|uniref:Uncharacterized protein n=1 Tax=Lasiosphaeria hispida TaxID=260671 RepID=A0AAJ0HNI1_9PEZI|nr:hypothetical protein B0T25DRAFT_580072 [Lasiosphaeria hispida]